MTSPQAAAADARLLELYGAPGFLPGGAALRRLGQRDDIHPVDVVAFRLASQEAVDAYLAANRDFYGLPPLGSYGDGDGFVGVADLRPAVISAGAAVSDPAAPDDQREWTLDGHAKLPDPGSCHGGRHGNEHP